MGVHAGVDGCVSMHVCVMSVYFNVCAVCGGVYVCLYVSMHCVWLSVHIMCYYVCVHK